MYSFAHRRVLAAATAAGMLFALTARADRSDGAATPGFGWSDQGSGIFMGRNAVPANRFGIKLYSIAGEPEGGRGPRGSDSNADSDIVQLYGDLTTPVRPTSPSGDGSALHTSTRPPLSLFGVSWQHRVSTRDSLGLATEYGDTSALDRPDTSQTRTGVSWTRAWGGEFRPSLTGSVFVGDETARDDSFRYLGRRFVGFSIGGQLNLFHDHAPYVALQHLRSYYDSVMLNDNILLSPRTDDRSLLAAGWRWQVQRNMSLEAGASYGLNGSSQDLYSQDRGRVYFGTRFDFR